MVSGGHDRDYTLKVAERTLDLIRAHRSPATPRAYAVWYAYVAALNPALTSAASEMPISRSSTKPISKDGEGRRTFNAQAPRCWPRSIN